MQKRSIPYEKQIFVCTNNKGGEGASCGDHQGESVFKELRRIAKERKLHPRFRVAQAKCLGQCQKGVNIMIYPDNVWLEGARVEDIKEIAEQIFSAEG